MKNYICSIILLVSSFSYAETISIKITEVVKGGQTYLVSPDLNVDMTLWCNESGAPLWKSEQLPAANGGTWHMMMVGAFLFNSSEECKKVEACAQPEKITEADPIQLSLDSSTKKLSLVSLPNACE